jgi:hypothetical protein
MKDMERDEELSALADKVWPGAWVEFDKWFDAPGVLHVLRYSEGLEGNVILLEISEHENARAAMKAALLVLSGMQFVEITNLGKPLVKTDD